MPLDTLMAESEGVPLRVHRAASGWAQAAGGGAAGGNRGQDGGRARRPAERPRRSWQEASPTSRSPASGPSLYVVAEPPDPAAPEVCPFRGLAPFDAAHAEYFFGRERLVADLVARLVGSTLIAVVGPSGSGKSSVLRAGLLPALADGVLPGSERWRQVVMRPGEHPLAELGRALARVAPDESEPDGDDPLAAALDALQPDERLVLAVDQLEEIFTACRDEGERDRLHRGARRRGRRPRSSAWSWCLAIRGDFYGRCAEYPGFRRR